MSEVKAFIVRPSGIYSNTERWAGLSEEEIGTACAVINERNEADYALISVIQDGFTPLEASTDYSFCKSNPKIIDGTLDETGKEALSELFSKYTPAVHRVSHQYSNERRVTGGPVMDESDVLQQAFLGLLHAALTWKQGGITFLSWAMPRMANHIENHSHDTRSTVRLPRHIRQKVTQLREDQWQDYQKTRAFKFGEVMLASRSGGQQEALEILFADSIANQMGTIDDVAGVGGGYFSDDRTQHSEQGVINPGFMQPVFPGSLQEFDQTSEEALNTQMNDYIKDLIVTKALAKGVLSSSEAEKKATTGPRLTNEESQVLAMSFGFTTMDPMRSSEIATALGWTQQKVGKHRHEALHKLRTSAKAMGLQDDTR
jgi:RNA polymerase sigma factor (sigma-70 family)